MDETQPTEAAPPTSPPVAADSHSSGPAVPGDDDNPVLLDGRTPPPGAARADALDSGKVAVVEDVIVQFPASARTSNEPKIEPVASPSKTPENVPVASPSKLGVNVASFGFLGVAKNHTWKPKRTTKNSKYPKVTASGTYFQDHSGGFTLIDRKTNKYLGHYTKTAIAKLEAKYGRKTQRRGTKSAVARINRDSRPDAVGSRRRDAS